MTDAVKEQLIRGAAAEQNVQGLLAIERSLRLEVAAKNAEIERLRAEINSKSEQIGKLYRVCNERDVLRAALKPFADYADPRRGVPPSFQITAGSQMARKQLLMQDCYRAKDALGDEQTSGRETK